MPPNALSIEELVKSYWRVPSYEFGKGQVIQTTVPHDRLVILNNRLADLSSLCVRLGGVWQYLGTSAEANSHVASTSVAVNAVVLLPLEGSASKESMVALIKEAEMAVVDDVSRTTMKAMRDVPDAETKQAVSRAEQLRWLGQYQCVHEVKPWTAELRFNRPIRMSNEGVVYKRDVVIDTILSPKPIN